MLRRNKEQTIVGYLRMDCLKLGYLQILGIYSSKLEERGLGLYISFLILPLRISFLSFFFLSFLNFISKEF